MAGVMQWSPTPSASWTWTRRRVGNTNPSNLFGSMGNHTIAEQMFRYDPRAMLYAPLRTIIWEDGEFAS
jgi:hypothetical protein